MNKERDNLGVLFERDGLFYLGIMDKKHNKIFSGLQETNADSSHRAQGFNKLNYKLLPGPNKMLPKVFFSKSRIDEFAPDTEIMRIYEQGTFKKGRNFSTTDCHKIIDFYKESINKHPEWKQFNFSFSPTEKYEDISDFFREISEQGYKLSFTFVPEDYIYGLVEDGKLYLFKIYNKDFSPFSKGKPNLHTLFWKAVFDEKNLADVVYKLNGKAEVFFRRKSISEKDEIVHHANEKLKKKNPELSGQKSLFNYDIIKDRRYTVDKFQFHVPITMNFKAQGSNWINDNVCAYISNNPDVRILGIDRGERHLLYISMIDRIGRVVKDEKGDYIQYSLNTVTGSYRGPDGKPVRFETPYRELLDRKEKERDEARKSWGTVENIKELKEGYMSQIVHHIASLMVKYNAVLFMEDLNSGFKRGRIKVEKQVYQKFEKALIDKLNYLVFKDYPADEPGGLYKALQLAGRFESFQKLQKQSGFIFYIPAWNTSKIDPMTGFTDQLKPKYSNVPEAKAFFTKFDAIYYDEKNDYFVFGFDYRNFPGTYDTARTKWDICTVGSLRYAFDSKANNGKGGCVRWNVTESLKKLFEKHGIDYRTKDLKDRIVGMDNKSFFIALIKNLQITLAMRYSSTEDGKDFILSPVADKNGEFFCSEGRDDGLPQDADANGAFNIARKGLMVLKKIDSAEKYGDWTTKIKNSDWLDFVQSL